MKQKLFLDSAIDKIDAKYQIEETKNGTFSTMHYIVAKENKKIVKKNIGDYFVIRFTYEKLQTKKNTLTKEVERIVKSFLKKYSQNKKVLIVGLGNKNVLADSLGIEVTDKLIATNHYQDFLTIPKIALLNPSVTEKTGINSFKLIKMVVEDLKPDVIIMIDSLATKDLNYLNSAIEINDTGIIPGSALNASQEINQKTFQIPVLSIGVPCCFEYQHQILSNTEIKEVIEASSTIIADALNHIFIECH